MRIETLSLQNFKRFEMLEVRFATRLTVIIGTNGMGKSSILQAIKILLSQYIKRLTDNAAHSASIALSEQDVRNGMSKATLGISIQDADQTVHWSLSATRKRFRKPAISRMITELSDWIAKLSGEATCTHLPVIVALPVTRAVFDIPLRIKKHHTFDIVSTYDGSLEAHVNFRTFFEWFRAEEDLENEAFRDAFQAGRAPHQRPGLRAVRDALSRFLPGFSDWRIQRSPLRMEVRKCSQILQVDQLSDGEKNLITLVGDLARRLSLANPGANDPLSGDGIVLIDEVELHLHPAWQATVLPLLIETFPNVQFIVSTHSPLILTQLNLLLAKQHQGLLPKNTISVLSIGERGVVSLIDSETGLLCAGEMDDVIESIDEAIERTLNEVN